MNEKKKVILRKNYRQGINGIIIIIILFADYSRPSCLCAVMTGCVNCATAGSNYNDQIILNGNILTDFYIREIQKKQ